MLFGRIPACKGVVAFAKTLRECEDELRSVLEDWVLVGLKLGHSLPVLDNIDLKKEAESKKRKVEEIAPERLAAVEPKTV